MRWRFLDTGEQGGAQNMAVDEAILNAVATGESQPTIRFYKWHPPCLSLGYFQSANTITWKACHHHGVSVVRRITGGRSILHHREVTYSIILPQDNHLLPKGVVPSYEKLSQGLKAGLERLGLKPRLTGRRSRKEGFSAACFDAPSWYELRIGKQKITGSAQIRKRGVLLQHGSVPLELDSKLLYALLDFSSEEKRRKACRRFTRRATAINPALRRRQKAEVNQSAIKKALLAGWRKTLKLDGKWGVLTPFEKKGIRTAHSGSLSKRKLDPQAMNLTINQYGSPV